MAEQRRRHKDEVLQLAAVQAHMASIGILMPGATAWLPMYYSNSVTAQQEGRACKLCARHRIIWCDLAQNRVPRLMQMESW